jgi:hypothetical protein
MARLQLELKDSVYVLGVGLGKVVRVLPDNGGYVVKVPGKGSQHYTVDGTVGSSTIKRLYYHDPIMVEPPKDERFWNLFKKLSLSIYERLVRLYMGGEVPESSEEEPEVDGDGDGEGDLGD